MGCNASKDEVAQNQCPKATPGPASTRSSSDFMIQDLIRQRSVMKRDSGLLMAEKLFKETNGRRFYDDYVRPTLVSYGGSCKVLTAFQRETEKKYAIKSIPKSNRAPEVQRGRVLKEVGILKEVEDHPNAIKLHQVYDDVHNYYLVMECCDGGELFEHISKGTEGFTERHAANILKSLMLFLAHMHSRGIAHMDIKPENIMFDAEGTKGVVKVIDFGASQYVQPEEMITDAFGTVRYSSPEMAADSGIGQKTDIWSAGALMYFMLSGSAPFLKKDDVDTLDYIKKKPKVKFSGRRWSSISEEAKDCIRAMLAVDPQLRPTAQQVLQHRWIRSQGPDVSIRGDILMHLRTFANQSRMRRLLLGLMAASISGGEANRLLDHFYAMDSDFSGSIEMQELAQVAKQALPDLKDEEVANLFFALDLNHTGTVDVKEFFASLLLTMDPENQIAVARRSFRNLDRHHSGYLSKKVFMDEMVKQAVINGMAQEDAAGLEIELEAEFRAIDANSDGQISFEEFQSVLGLEGPSDANLGEAKAKIEEMMRKRNNTPTGGKENQVHLQSSPMAAATLPRSSSPACLAQNNTGAARASSSNAGAARASSSNAGAARASSSSAGADGEKTPIVKRVTTDTNLVLLALSIRARSQSRTQSEVASVAQDLTPRSVADLEDSEGSKAVESRVLSEHPTPFSSSPGDAQPRDVSSANSSRPPDPQLILPTSQAAPRGTSGHGSTASASSTRTGSGTRTPAAVAAAAMAAAVAATVASQPPLDDALREAYLSHDPGWPQAPCPTSYNLSAAEMDRLLCDDDKELEPVPKSITKDEPNVRFRDNPISLNSPSQKAAALSSLGDLEHNIFPSNDGVNASQIISTSRSNSMSHRGILKNASMTRQSSLNARGGGTGILAGLSSCTSGDQQVLTLPLSPVLSPSLSPVFVDDGVSHYRGQQDSNIISDSAALKSNPDVSSSACGNSRTSSPNDCTAVPIITH